MKLYKYNKNSLQFESIKIKHYIYSILIIGLIFSGFGFTTAIKLNEFVEKIPILIHLEEEIATPEKVKQELIKLNIQNVDVVYAQILIESGNFTSNIWKNNNNCSGMKLAKTRATTAIGEQFNHALYKNWRDGLLDIALWQSCYAKNLSQEQYLKVIGEIYAEDSQYLTKIRAKL